MACQDANKTINGREYYVVQMTPDKAIPIQLKLTKILGGSIGKLGAAMKGDFSQQAEALGESVTALFENASEEEIFALIKKVVTTAKVDGERIDIAIHFQGEYLADIYKVFFWVLGVNFSSFFGANGLDGFLGRMKAIGQAAVVSAATAKPAKQPQT